MRKNLCGAPSCDVLIDKPGYCSKHFRQKKPFENAQRSNHHLYNTQRWKNIRKDFLKKYPFCFICENKNKGLLDIHHIKPPRGNEELFFAAENLQVVCKECHRIITAREISERNKKKY